MFVAVLLFLVGLGLLIKGGDWFVDGASGIARRFHLPEILIGATIVSIGTTLPELMVSATSAVEGHSGIAYGNAVGSIICNTALVSAITITFSPGPTEKKSFRLPLIFFFISAAFYVAVAYIFREFSRLTGIILLLIFVAYTIVSVIVMKKNGESAEAPSVDTGDIFNDEQTEEEKPKEYKNAFMRFYKGTSLAKDIIFLIIGAGLIAIGARLLVDNGTLIAKNMGVPESVIALTFVALGTSLPELVTAITALVKKHSNLSLGNVIGANFFNVVLVCGTAATLKPFELPVEGKMILGLPSSLVVDVPLMMIVMLIMTIPVLAKGKMYRTQGIILLLIYSAFCVFQFVAG